MKIKRTIPILLALIAFSAFSQSTIEIGGTSYAVSVTEYRQLTPEAEFTAYSSGARTAFPLKFFVTKIDCRASNLKVEAWSGLDYTLNGKETPPVVASRKTNNDFQVLSAINGDFFGSLPCGAEIVKGEMSQNILSTEFFIGGVDFTPYAGIDYSGKPIVDVFRFTPYVKKLTGDSLFLKKEINSANRWENEFIIYNGYFSAATTPTNEWGHECLISPVGGDWTPDENGYIRCAIEKIRLVTDTKKMDIVPGKAVLSGHGTARQFLVDLQVGDEVLVSWGAKLVYHPEVRAIREAVAGGTMCLRNGEKQEYTVTDAAREKDRHPRTCFGVSEDRNYMYFVVIDGRAAGVSVGVSTKEEADIMKFLGAHDAVNLDGGGSSCIVANGAIKNTPSDGTPRLVVNGLLLAKTGGGTAIPAVSDANFRVYPNPVTNELRIENGKLNIENIEIFDVSGKKTLNTQYSTLNTKHSTLKVDVSHLPSGVYFYKVTGEGKNFSGKFIVKKD